MVGSSKILTVSYGTFSCTLEGFDDSFGAMKAIAEYFRDLAADDRYFGAEPPTPDAEMLARIAEREISRHVEAREDGAGITLRAEALPHVTTPVASATDDQNTEQNAPSGDADAKSPTDKTTAPTPAQEDPVVAPDGAVGPSDMEQPATQTAQDEAHVEDKSHAEQEQPATTPAEQHADTSAAPETGADADTAHETRDEADEQQDTITAVSKDLADDSAEPAAQSDEQQGDIKTTASAVTLAAIGAAVAHDALTSDEQDGTAEAEATEEGDNAPSELSEPVDADHDQTPQQHDTDETPPEQTDEHANDSASVAPEQSDAASHAAEPEQAEEIEQEATEDGAVDGTPPEAVEAQTEDSTNTPQAEDAVDASENDAAADPDSVAAKLMRIRAVVGNADMDTSNDATEPVQVDAPTPDVADAVMSTIAQHDEADSDADVEHAAAAREFDPEADEMEPMAALPDEGDENDHQSGPDFGFLDGADELDSYLEDSDAEEDTADLATIDIAPEHIATPDDQDTATQLPVADTQTDADFASADAVISAKLAHDAPNNAFAVEDSVVDDAALDRLITETDAQLNEPEGHRRRDAIAQLKAAVAAKQAARRAGEDDADNSEMENAFRNDMSEMRATTAPPRRPVLAEGRRTERPRPAPLKLVASQRVDTGQNAAQPIIPRRVKADTSGENTGSFAAFAQQMGARELPDLLEAAAAYTSFVEGADEFSRPQIMRRARAVTDAQFNREDGLRSFAELLRSGRFTKVRNGRFQVADDSRFNPDRQAS